MSSDRRYRKEEILEQLDDLGAFRRETEAERIKAEKALAEAEETVRDSINDANALAEKFAELEREIDARLDGIYRSTAKWSHRAAQAGISEGEVLERIEIAKGPASPPEDWEYEA
ncbi:MAG: hypothetical protein J0H66_02575 [Solirubrobacterales bacterium]|nr:hypothetical protein [Solirubrobacterales bacterium]OJU95280.1 MAG: hypothetical protein BGO23_05305 [Solirubrobacterales bacterium 67-14]